MLERDAAIPIFVDCVRKTCSNETIGNVHSVCVCVWGVMCVWQKWCIGIKAPPVRLSLNILQYLFLKVLSIILLS